MNKEQTNFRIDRNAKQKAYAVLHQIGLKPTDAVNMFMHHIAMYGELPFKPAIPNKKTMQAFSDTESKSNLTQHDTIDDIFETL